MLNDAMSHDKNRGIDKDHDIWSLCILDHALLAAA